MHTHTPAFVCACAKSHVLGNNTIKRIFLLISCCLLTHLLIQFSCVCVSLLLLLLMLLIIFKCTRPLLMKMIMA